MTPRTIHCPLITSIRAGLRFGLILVLIMWGRTLLPPETLPAVPMTLLRVDCFPRVISCLFPLSNGSAYLDSPATGVIVW